MRDIFGVIYFFLLLIIPLQTMKLLSEEKRMGTSELLLTFPIRDWEIVLGKFLACSGVIAIIVIPTWVYPALLYHYQAPPEMPVLLCAYLGIFLGAVGFVALGMFISSMTENQIIAASVHGRSLHPVLGNRCGGRKRDGGDAAPGPDARLTL